ncbi:unnamed protein product [Sphagnum balticum]
MVACLEPEEAVVLQPAEDTELKRGCWATTGGDLSKEKKYENLEMGEEAQRGAHYVNWFREAWPYIQGHRGSTFVLVIPGEVIEKRRMMDCILQDVALIHGLGIKLVIVPGSHVQTDKLLRARGHEPKYVGPYRVTDSASLEASMEAAGRIRVDIEAKLSRGLPIPILRRHGENERWHEAGVSVASGNYVSAKPRGIVNGIDFGSTGEVKKIDVVRIKERLENNCIVMLSNLGYSGSGEVLNCNAYEVATACATALRADKLLCLLDGQTVDENGHVIRFMTLQEADQLIRQQASQNHAAADYVRAVAGPAYIRSLGIPSADNGLQQLSRAGGITVREGLNSIPSGSDEICNDSSTYKNGRSVPDSNTTEAWERRQGFAIGGEQLSQGHLYLSELTAAVYVCRGGVRRVHLLDSNIQGALLLELYTRDGIGTMVSSDMYEGTRDATINDVGGIEQLLRPLVELDIVVNRPREQLLQELQAYTVVERDGSIIACAALFPYAEDESGEVAAFAVSPECQGHGQGDSLLDYVERKARKLGLRKLFLLTTRTADWFVRRGFSQCTWEELPERRRVQINLARGSKYYVKMVHEADISSADNNSHGSYALDLPQ